MDSCQELAGEAVGNTEGICGVWCIELWLLAIERQAVWPWPTKNNIQNVDAPYAPLRAKTQNSTRSGTQRSIASVVASVPSDMPTAPVLGTLEKSGRPYPVQSSHELQLGNIVDDLWSIIEVYLIFNAKHIHGLLSNVHLQLLICHVLGTTCSEYEGCSSNLLPIGYFTLHNYEQGTNFRSAGWS